MNTASRLVISKISSAIESPSELWSTRARAHLDVLTKPLGSLGMLEDIAAQMVSIRQVDFAEPLQKAVYVFAADNGVTTEGVSAYPSEVTFPDRETTSYTAAAIILAADALTSSSAAAGLFRHDSLPMPIDLAEPG